MNLPRAVVSSVGWFQSGGKALQLLMVFHEPGRTGLLPWEPFGEAVLTRRRELIQEAESGDGATTEDLLLLEDRYSRITLPSDRRLSLGIEGLLHLDLEEGVRSRVYVVRAFDRIFIMSSAYRIQRLRAGSEALSDLP